MVEQRQRMRFAAAELRREVENCVRLRPLAREASDDFGREGREVFREIRPFEEPLRLLVIGGSAPFAYLVEMHGEFRRVERLAFTQVLARGDDFKPWF